MKKIFTLLLVCVATLTFAQSYRTAQYKANMDNSLQQVKHSATTQKVDAVWSCDFEEGSPAYVLGKTEESTKDWVVGTLENIPECWGSPTEGWYIFPFYREAQTASGTDTVVTYSETPTTWAYIDIICDYFAGGQGVYDSWIQFDNIDLSEVSAPQVSLKQIFRPLNSTFTYVEVSIDGGATWTQHQVNSSVAGNDYAPYDLDCPIMEAANEEVVSIRFHVAATETGLRGYAWEIDDIKVVSLPSTDLKVIDGRTNMFGYTDYRDETSNYFGSNFYNLNPQYGQTSREQWAAGVGSWFNAEVQNKGVTPQTPVVNIKITSPSGSVIYDQSVTGNKELGIYEIDTIDFKTEELAFAFLEAETIDDIEIGRYDVTYSVVVENDENEENNSYTSYFYITENVYSREADGCNSSIGPSNWQSGGNDGDEIASSYIYFYLPDDKLSVDVYVDDRSAAGTSFQVIAYEYNADSELTQTAASDLIEVTEENLGSWVHADFTDDFFVNEFDEGYQNKSLLISVKFNYNGDSENNPLYIGCSTRNTSSFWNVKWRMGDDVDFTSFTNHNGSALGIRLHNGEDYCSDPNQNLAVASNSISNIQVYPNPTNNNITIANAEGENIVVLNTLGQVVANIENASENQTISLSGLAEGTYFVKVNADVVKINVIR